MSMTFSSMHFILFLMLMPYAISVPLSDFFNFNTTSTCYANQTSNSNVNCEILFQRQLNYSYDFQLHHHIFFPYFSEQKITKIYVSNPKQIITFTNNTGQCQWIHFIQQRGNRSISYHFSCHWSKYSICVLE